MADDTGGQPDAYLVEHIRDALAHDPRVSQPGISVTVAGGKVLLSGEVATAERKSAATEVAEPLAEGRAVHNALTVSAPFEPADREDLA
jgi:osmotically-inducible protein OsmY